MKASGTHPVCAHAPEVAAADSSSDSATQGNNSKKKSVFAFKPNHDDVLKNAFNRGKWRVSISNSSEISIPLVGNL